MLKEYIKCLKNHMILVVSIICKLNKGTQLYFIITI